MIVLGKKIHLTSFRVISFGFLFTILAGSFLLMSPFSTRGPANASFIDSLFTATSAVCVTGLVVHDTATYWTSFGHVVIISLIQIGGMGVITVAVALAMISGRKIGLMQRSTMKEAIAAPHVGGIVRLTRFIVKITITIECLGALIMAPVFIRDFGIGKGIWYAFFHSISAFCNAGFDLMGIRGQYSSLTSYVAQPAINLAIMGLIISGGLGFLTWEDICTYKYNIKKYRMQSKMILTATAILIFLPTVFFFIADPGQTVKSLSKTSSSTSISAFSLEHNKFTCSQVRGSGNTADKLFPSNRSGETFTLKRGELYNVSFKAFIAS